MNQTDTQPLTFQHLPLSPELVRELRSDHAGELGAVYIYRGILAISRNPELRRFAREHLATEQEHLSFFQNFLPKQHRSRLVPLWRMAGWLIGALPACFGTHAVYATIEAVEYFVKEHYERQIVAMQGHTALTGLSRYLAAFQQDEIHHLRDAGLHCKKRVGWFTRFWMRLVTAGSVAGVQVAKRF